MAHCMTSPAPAAARGLWPLSLRALPLGLWHQRSRRRLIGVIGMGGWCWVAVVGAVTLVVPTVVALPADAAATDAEARGSTVAQSAAGLPHDAESYQVQVGDTLWAIAGRELGNPYRWPEIAAGSASIVQPDGLRLVDPDLIRPGWTLALPGAPPDQGRTLLSGATAIDAGAPAFVRSDRGWAGRLLGE